MSLSKYKHRILADFIVVLHVAVVLLLVFGWKLPDGYIWMYHVGLVLVIVFGIIFGGCILTIWEYNLRKKTGVDISFEDPFIIYYVYKNTRLRIPPTIFRVVSVSFYLVSIGVQIYIYKYLK